MALWASLGATCKPWHLFSFWLWGREGRALPPQGPLLQLAEDTGGSVFRPHSALEMLTEATERKAGHTGISKGTEGFISFSEPVCILRAGVWAEPRAVCGSRKEHTDTPQERVFLFLRRAPPILPHKLAVAGLWGQCWAHLVRAWRPAPLPELCSWFRLRAGEELVCG